MASSKSADDVCRKLRTVVLEHEVRSVAGVQSLIQQFRSVEKECDSPAHGTAADALQWSLRRIGDLEITIKQAAESLGLRWPPRELCDGE